MHRSPTLVPARTLAEAVRFDGRANAPGNTAGWPR